MSSGNDEALRLVAVALVAHGERQGEPTYIVTRRKKDAHLGGAWELPGGKIETGESPRDAVQRELREELGIEVEAIAPLTFSHFRYPNREVLLLFHACRTIAGHEPRPLAADALELLTLAEILTLPMPPANEPFKDHMRMRLGAGGFRPYEFAELTEAR